MNFLVLQNEKNQAKYIAKGLQESGHVVDFASTLEEAYDFYEMTNYDIIILDTKISYSSGIEFCKKIRNSNSMVGIIFISSEKSVDVKVRAFSCGCDDYLEKPFHFIELLARISALDRRLKNSCSMENNKITLRDLELNYLTREVYRGEKKIELTSKEFALLEYFIRNRNIVLTRTLIKEKVWGIDFVSGTNIVDVYVTHLRNKIDKGYEDRFFHTIRGAGYVLK